MRRRWLVGLALAVVAAGAGFYALTVYKRDWAVAIASTVAGQSRDWATDRLYGPEARTELVSRPCGFTTESGRTMVCYDLHVPENRARAGSRRVKLPILVFEASERPKKPDPVVLISGGPGAIAYTEAAYASMWKDKFKDLPWLKGRDLIVYDQRGVGGARPALECPEVDATREDPLNLERAKSAMVACHDRLVRDGIDLLTYDTNTNADDVASMQAMFGFKEWNLWGQSYGTRVALTYMRRNPPGVRTVILDGAYPPEVAGTLNISAAFITVLDRIFEACASDEECKADYPDLRKRFEEVVLRLRERPAAVKSESGPLLPPKVYQVNDVIFLSIIDSLLYTADGIAKLPWLVDRMANGKDEALAEPIVDWDLVAYGPYVTAGISYVVDCNDSLDPDDADERRAAQRQPYLAPWLGYALAIKPCQIWTTRQTPALDRSPVTSTIPTAVISGWFDIATPSEWGDITVRSLKRAQLIRVRAASHDASDAACAETALGVFLETPTADLSTYCGPTPSHPRFKRKTDNE